MAALVAARRAVGKALGLRAMATAAPAALPDLPYDYGALEPAISADIMQLHHSKHHATYVNNFNATMEKVLDAQAKGDTAGAIALQGAVKFNGGGHVNHSIFWSNLCPMKDYTPPEGELLAAIEAEFGSLDQFQAKFSATAAGVQGSGWGWLGYDKASGRLAIASTANQDPCVTTGLVPLLGVDVWEHAYYLQYKNVRPDYLKAVWGVVNWRDVGRRLADARA